MMFDSISKEYFGLLENRHEIKIMLESLPAGYISVKCIAGHSYSYLQQRVKDKVGSKYLKKDIVSRVTEQLDTRKQLEERLQSANKQLECMEEAVHIMSPLEARGLERMKYCFILDHLSSQERAQARLFSAAMMTLEGVPSSEEVEKSIDAWVEGKGSFSDSYLNTLKKYHLAERK